MAIISPSCKIVSEKGDDVVYTIQKRVYLVGLRSLHFVLNSRLTNMFLCNQEGLLQAPPKKKNRNQRFYFLALVSMDRYWSHLTIDTSLTKIGQGIAKL